MQLMPRSNRPWPRVSLSLIPGEAQFSATPSLASEILIKPEHPRRAPREGQGRLRRKAPPLQGRHRSRLHGQLHRQRCPDRRLPGRRGPALRPLSDRTRAADLRADDDRLPDEIEVNGQASPTAGNRPDLSVRPDHPPRYNAEPRWPRSRPNSSASRISSR